VVDAAQPASFEVVMAAQETRYLRGGRMRGRAHNVELAASRLDLAVIPAGGQISFNAAVGARGRDDGYRMAPVIQDGQLVDGVGGGVCQVASTLHAAALHAGLEVVDHKVHSRPSTYTGLAMDAAVAWPDRDLVIANPNAFPVLVQARAAGGVVHVELRGAEAAPAVTIAIEDEVIPFIDVIEEDPALAVGERVVISEGREGHFVHRTRTIGERVERRSFRYHSSARVIRVGVAAPVVAPAAPPASPVVPVVAAPAPAV
jgi:vancomycin resistance protein YoaR